MAAAYALFFLGAMIFSWNDWTQTNPLTWIMALLIVGTVVGAPAMIVLIERMRARPAATRA